MLSQAAYEIASVLVTGAATVHELKASIATTGVPPSHVDEWLHAALQELVSLGFATFMYEPRYGDLPPVSPVSMTSTEFESYWNQCFEDGVSGVPESNRTISAEITDGLIDELAKEEYSNYEA